MEICWHQKILIIELFHTIRCVDMLGNVVFSGNEQATKRRGIRVSPEAEHPIRIDLMGSNFIEVIGATDISLAGVRISVTHNFNGYNLEDRVDILILLPSPLSHSISTTARVVHLQGGFFGAEFVRLERQDYRKLHEYIAYRIKNENLKTRLLHALQRIKW